MWGTCFACDDDSSGLDVDGVDGVEYEKTHRIYLQVGPTTPTRMFLPALLSLFGLVVCISPAEQAVLNCFQRHPVLKITLPSDPEYPEERDSYNHRVSGGPVAIVHPTNTDQVLYLSFSLSPSLSFFL